MEKIDCKHKWIVTVDEDNYPEDIMCSECKEVVLMLVGDQAVIMSKD